MRSSRTRWSRGRGRPRDQLASGWGYYLGDAAIANQLCFGPPQGQRVTFVHPDDWLGPQRTWGPVDALREVARRYATTYGPVSRPPVSGVVQLAELHAGRRARALGRHSRCPSPNRSSHGPSVRLLPEYDVYVMGFREREHLVPEAVREQVAAHGKGRYEGPAGVPFLLVDGVCAGFWSRTKRAKRIELHVEPARRLTRAERSGVTAEAERIGAFLGLEPVLTVAADGSSVPSETTMTTQVVPAGRRRIRQASIRGPRGAARVDRAWTRSQGRRLVRRERARGAVAPRGGAAAICSFEGEPEFAQLGINISVLEPGEAMAMYHWEADQEDFLVLAGEALLIVEGEERPLRQWDFVHCPPETKHVIVGAGTGPCLVLAIGARDLSATARTGAATRSTRPRSGTVPASSRRRPTRPRPTRA